MLASCAGKLESGKRLTMITAVVTNWDLCEVPSNNPVCKQEPLAVAIARARSLRTTSAQVATANAKWWSKFWNASWVSLPGDPTLEGFYYSTMYMIASASRRGKMAAGLWGPWVHSDAPAWQGDFTIDYK